MGSVAPAGSHTWFATTDFEPALGQRAECALDAISLKTRAGRPTLLETHRFNFTGSRIPLPVAIQELDRLLEEAIRRFDDVQFMSTQELAFAMIKRDSALIALDFVSRLRAWLLRIRQERRVRRLTWMTGAIVPAALLFCALSVAAAIAKRRRMAA